MTVPSAVAAFSYYGVIATAVYTSKWCAVIAFVGPRQTEIASTAGMTNAMHDVLTLAGSTTGLRTASFQTGLTYGASLSYLFDRHCNSCHSGDRPAGKTTSTSWIGERQGGDTLRRT